MVIVGCDEVLSDADPGWKVGGEVDRGAFRAGVIADEGLVPLGILVARLCLI